MRIGTLNRLVTLLSRTAGQDALGQPMTTWSTAATVWANIRSLSGVEAIKSGADVSTVKASIRIRWRTGVDAGMRVANGADTYDIKAVLPDGRRQYIDLVCELVK
jgi:SPP1 family predicted phage head-tail adaptor